MKFIVPSIMENINTVLIPDEFYSEAPIKNFHPSTEPVFEASRFNEK